MDDHMLKIFIKEHFDFEVLKEAGFFNEDISKDDYKGQAKRIREFFGFKSIYEYGSKTIRCHLTLDSRSSVNEKGELIEEPFITELKSIYES